MTPPNLPPLDTPEARWAYVLKLWHERNLPTPEQISVRDDLTVWLPCNERGQADQWAKALSIEDAPAVYHPTRNDGSPNCRAWYAATSSSTALGKRWVMCDMDLTADAEAHGGPLVRPEPDELAAAVDGVVAMLGGGRDE